jgi:hypothetical protein
MNTKSKIVLSLGLLSAPLALWAWSPESAYVASYRGRTGIPVPLSVVTPELAAKYTGQTVVFEFVVDATGKPVQIAPAAPNTDAELVASVTAAITQWRFAPALVDGRPVARKVVLPLNIVGQFDPAPRFALK